MTALAPEAASTDLATTPIIPGYHPDPSICRANGRFYLANSSFEYTPGVPIWSSTDLVVWEQIGNALDRPSQFPPGERRASRGIFAPTLRFHDDRFWLITTDVDRPGGGQVLFTAADAAGQWSEPIVVPVDGIDPDIAWDDAGRCFVTWCRPADGTSTIAQVQIDAESGALLERPRALWSGTGLAFPEGPHIHRRGDWWYLLLAEGGTERGHTVAIARSRSLTGPFEGHPQNPILSHRSTTHPVQNTGHADLVSVGDGDWALVYLGVRPRGTSPMFHVNGRETFIGGVDWSNDWPVVDETRFHAPPQPTAFSDDFTRPRFDPRWVSPGARIDSFATLKPGGGVVLTPRVAPNGSPSALCVRTVDEHWTVEVEFGDLTGGSEVFVRLDDRHSYALRIADGTAVARFTIGELSGPVGTVLETISGRTTAVIRSVVSEHGGPDDIVIGVAADGDRVRTLARLDGRYLSTEVAGGFTGRVVGVRACAGPVVLRRFAYRPAVGVLADAR